MPFVVVPAESHTVPTTAPISFDLFAYMESEELRLALDDFPQAPELDNSHPATATIPSLPFLPAIPSIPDVRNTNIIGNYDSSEEGPGEEDDAEDMFTIEGNITADLEYLRPRITDHSQATPTHPIHHNMTSSVGSRGNSDRTSRRQGSLLPDRHRGSIFDDIPALSPPLSETINSNSNSNNNSRSGSGSGSGSSGGYAEDRRNHYRRYQSPRNRHRSMLEPRQPLVRSPRRAFHSPQNCIFDGTTMDLSSYGCPTQPYTLLDFNVVMEDGGSYSSYYSVENILRNDSSVYCSGRNGTINILLQYSGSPLCHPVKTDKSCVLSQIIIKSPQHGFTAPCKEGMFFVSRNPIDVDGTSKFDRYTRQDFDQYISAKGGLYKDDQDPVAWFRLSDDNQDVIKLDDRVCKYVLLKLLRAEHESENIDLQHVALIGYSGARYFGSARLC